MVRSSRPKVSTTALPIQVANRYRAGMFGNRLKLAFTNACFVAGFAPAQRTELSTVLSMIERLRPVLTQHGLIRIGPRGDGGYLVPDDLVGVIGCFSPGVGWSAAFERAIHQKGIPCFLADGSIENPPLEANGMHFVQRFLGVVSDETTITLDDWVDANIPGGGDLILQMDIDGAEWPVLLSVSRNVLCRFRIIAVEFHNLERLMDKHGFAIIKATFDRLLRDFYIVHNHPNNFAGSVRFSSLVIPRAQEITFLRKDRGSHVGFATSFPHPLDTANNEKAPDIPLPRAWFGSKEL